MNRGEKVPLDNYGQAPNPVSLANSNLFNAMIYPFTRMVVYGAIWYQGIWRRRGGSCVEPDLLLGEANAGYNTDKYACTFSKMIQSWRETWHVRTGGLTNIQFPFGFVQVSGPSLALVDETIVILSAIAIDMVQREHHGRRISTDSMASNVRCWLRSEQCSAQRIHGSGSRSTR
jgi:hypothetical protein